MARRSLKAADAEQKTPVPPGSRPAQPAQVDGGGMGFRSREEPGAAGGAAGIVLNRVVAAQIERL
jgi:hypothetical protein